jgi:hypothetical protein
VARYEVANDACRNSDVSNWEEVSPFGGENAATVVAHYHAVIEEIGIMRGEGTGAHE